MHLPQHVPELVGLKELLPAAGLEEIRKRKRPLKEPPCFNHILEGLRHQQVVFAGPRADVEPVGLGPRVGVSHGGAVETVGFESRGEEVKPLQGTTLGGLGLLLSACRFVKVVLAECVAPVETAAVVDPTAFAQPTCLQAVQVMWLQYLSLLMLTWQLGQRFVVASMSSREAASESVRAVKRALRSQGQGRWSPGRPQRRQEVVPHSHWGGVRGKG